MGFLIFLGSFLAVAAVVSLIYFQLRSKVRGFSQRVFGNADILKALEDTDSIEDQSPRSLNGCDNLLMPQILKDFPDFDENLAKTYARDILNRKFGHLDGFTIYKVVFAQYLRSAAQKTIVMQAAASFHENGKKTQKRYNLHYTYILSGSSETVAANCPNCGGALGYGVTVCPYCDSRVANILGNTWKFTEILES